MSKIVVWDVDTQEDFIRTDGKLSVPEAENIRKNLGKLTQYGSENGYKMTGSVDAHLPNDPEFEQFGEHCVYGTPGQFKIPETRLEQTLFVPVEELTESQLEEALAYDGQTILEKRTISCKTNANLGGWFEALDPDVILAYGVVTELCVGAAIEHLADDLGYTVVVVEDAIMHLGKEDRDEVFAHWDELGVERVTTQQVLSGYLEQVVGE